MLNYETQEVRKTKRIVFIAGNILFWTLAISIMLSIGCQQFLDKTWGWAMVNGTSMVPTFQKGDYVFVVPFIGGIQNPPQAGKIVAFKDGQGKTTIHRIVGSTGDGFITKGDGNSYADQDAGQPIVTTDVISGTALTIGGWAFHIPVLGSLALTAIKPEMRKIALFILLAAIAIVLAFGFWRRGEKAPRRRAGLTAQRSTHSMLWKYSVVTVIGTILLMSVLVRLSNTSDYSYNVSDDKRAAAVSGGINLGGVAPGGETKSSIETGTNFPIGMKALFLTGDTSIKFTQNPVAIPPDKKLAVDILVSAANGVEQGLHISRVTMLVLPSIFPDDILHLLAGQGQLLVLFLISLPLVLILTVPAGIAEYYLSKETRIQKVRRMRRRLLSF